MSKELNCEWCFKDGMTLDQVLDVAWNVFCKTNSPLCRNHVDAAVREVLSCLVIRPASAPVGVRLRSGVTWEMVAKEVRRKTSFIGEYGDLPDVWKQNWLTAAQAILPFLCADVPPAVTTPNKVWRFRGQSFGTKELAEAAALALLRKNAEQDEEGWGWHVAAMAAEHNITKILGLLTERSGSGKAGEWRITEEEVKGAT